MKPLTSIGIDPDLHSTAYAVVIGGLPRMVGLATVPSTYKGRSAVILSGHALSVVPWPKDDVDRVIIETPQQYGRGRNRVDPEDLINLAAVSGAALGVLQREYPDAAFAMPAPSVWKGQVSKTVHHRRLMKTLGWEFSLDSAGRVYPKWPDTCLGWGRLPVSKAHHVLDAIGMALWADEIAAGRHLKASLSQLKSR